MDTETLQWSTAISLPHPLFLASATLCGDQVYMLGGFDQNDKPSKSVFTCSLDALLQSCQPQSLEERLKTLSSASRPKVWHQLAETPVPYSHVPHCMDNYWQWVGGIHVHNCYSHVQHNHQLLGGYQPHDNSSISMFSGSPPSQ